MASPDALTQMDSEPLARKTSKEESDAETAMENSNGADTETEE